MWSPSRREFLKSTVTTACSAGLGAWGSAELLGASHAAGTALANLAAAPLPIKKGLVMDMLPAKLGYADRMKLARDAGFEVVQAPTTPDQHEAEAIKRAADAANIRVDSVMNMDHWQYPLSSGDPTAVEKSLEGMRTSLHNAKLWGSDAVLLVPAVVNAQTSYREAWSRSQAQIRKLLPLAEDLKIVVAIEEVWNKFLLSPLEMAAYIKEFQSPWIQAWFDVGNVVLYGGDEAYLRDVSRRVDRLVLGRP